MQILYRQYNILLKYYFSLIFYSFKEAWALARILDSKETWTEFGKKAIYHLDIELGELNGIFSEWNC